MMLDGTEVNPGSLAGSRVVELGAASLDLGWEGRIMAETWLDLAQAGRKSASTLLAEGYCRSAISRAYYAAYSKVSHELVATGGLPMPPGREGLSHLRIRAVIQTSMPHMAQAQRDKLSEIFGRLYTLRIDADYRPSSPVEAAEARAGQRGKSHVLLVPTLEE